MNPWWNNDNSKGKKGKWEKRGLELKQFKGGRGRVMELCLSRRGGLKGFEPQVIVDGEEEIGGQNFI